MTNKLTKQVYEKFSFTGDFSNVLENAETIDSASTAIITDKNGTDTTSTMLDSSLQEIIDGKITLRIQAGEVLLSPYNIAIQIITDLDNQWQIDIELTVTA